MGIRLVDRKIGTIFSSDPVHSKRAFSDRVMYYSQHQNRPEAGGSKSMDLPSLEPCWEGLIYTYTARVSVSESVSEPLTELYLHYIRGSDPRSSEALAILGSLQ